MTRPGDKVMAMLRGIRETSDEVQGRCGLCRTKGLVYPLDVDGQKKAICDDCIETSLAKLRAALSDA